MIWICAAVSFVAGGKRLERLRKEGLIVNGKRYFIPVVPPEDLSAPADLIIVAVKYHHLDDAIRDMRNRVGAETAIISVMNGIESEERIGAVYGMEKVLYAVSVGIDALQGRKPCELQQPGENILRRSKKRISYRPG